MDAVRRALMQVARDVHVPVPPQRRLADRPSTTASVELAVLAVRAQSALELLAAEFIDAAREEYGVTWEQVGTALGTSAQSAHTRFRRVSARPGMQDSEWPSMYRSSSSPSSQDLRRSLGAS